MDAAIFGIIVADVIGTPIDPANPPKPGGLQFVDSVTLTSGGNVCNVGIAMARLGMNVAAAGVVGDDALGRALLERLKSAPMDTSAVTLCPNVNTCATIVMVSSNGERSFYHAPGATDLLDAGAFRKCFGIFRQCAWVQIGYFGLLPKLTPELPGLLVALKKEAPGAKIALDTLDPPADWKLLEPILPHLDLFAPSRPEAEFLSGGEKSPGKMVAFFRQFMPRGLIGIKLDSDGCYLDDRQESVIAPAYKVNVLDTTGAGDAWFAGLLAGLRQNRPLDECARLANRVAADCCTALGASAGIKTFQETIGRI